MQVTTGRNGDELYDFRSRALFFTRKNHHRVYLEKYNELMTKYRLSNSVLIRSFMNTWPDTHYINALRSILRRSAIGAGRQLNSGRWWPL